MDILKHYKKYIYYSIVVIITIGLFVVIAQISQRYDEELQAIVLSTGVWAPITYMGILFASTVVAPLGSSFLIPVAANAFGPFMAGVYSVIGWLSGSLVAFYLAKRYGYGRLQSWSISKKAHYIESHFSKLKQYIILILLRVALPVDVVSYILGLFTSISYFMFTITTLIGVLPFAFLFTYASVLHPGWQVAVSVLSYTALFAGIYVSLRYKPPEDTKTNK